MQSQDPLDLVISLCEERERRLGQRVIATLPEPALPEEALAVAVKQWDGSLLGSAVIAGYMAFCEGMELAAEAVHHKALKQIREALEHDCDDHALTWCEAAYEYRALAAGLEEHARDLDELQAAIGSGSGRPPQPDETAEP